VTRPPAAGGGAWPCALAFTARFGLPGIFGAEAGLPLPRRTCDRGRTAHSRAMPRRGRGLGWCLRSRSAFGY
jgi:hypothetical protein